MERTSPRDEVNELDIIITDYMPDHMPDRFWTAYERIKQLAKQAGWPIELHKQYMKSLDDRDKLQEKVDQLEEEISVLRVEAINEYKGF